jgi:hypothetical protein
MVCPRCNGDKVVVKGAVIEGMAMTEKCPVCDGKGEIEKQGSHFEPSLRK